jgi:hypothetical protein
MEETKKGIHIGKDVISKFVILSGIMLIINPPFHSVMMVGMYYIYICYIEGGVCKKIT